MRIISWISIIIFSVLFIACSDEHESDGLSTGEDEGWLSLAIGFAKSEGYSGRGAVSKADNIVAGEMNEQKVNDFRLVFYSDDKVAYSFDLDIQTNAAGTAFEGEDVILPNSASADNNGKISFSITPVIIKRKNYKVIAFVNPPGNLKSITEPGQLLSTLVDVAADITSVTDICGVDYSNFYMSNTSGPLTIKDIAGKGGFHYNYDDALNDKSSPVLAVERAVSKVHFSLGADLVNKDTIIRKGYVLHLSGMEWTVDVLNKKTYWLRHMTYKKGGVKESNMEQPGDYVSYDSGLSRRLFLYAEDPNFEGVYQKSDQELADQFSYYKSTVAEWVWASPDTIFYVPENTMDYDEDFKMNVSTQLILKIPFSPVAEDKFLVEATPYMYYRIPIRHFVDNALQEIGGEEEEEEGGSGPGGEEEVSGGGGFVGSGVTYWGAYGVVRNNFYKLVLNSITDLGAFQLETPPEAVQNKY